MSTYDKVIMTILVIVTCISIVFTVLYYSNVYNTIEDTKQIKRDVKNIKMWQNSVENDGINIK